MEIWKTIPEFPCYQASTEGQIRNFRGKVISARQVRGGYMAVPLTNRFPEDYGKRNSKPHRRINCFVHRLVAECFIPHRSGATEVDHINHDPKDNRVSNLRWVTRSENGRHRKRKISRRFKFADVFVNKPFLNWLEENRVSVEALGAQNGIGVIVIYKALRGTPINIDPMQRIAKATGMSILTLFPYIIGASYDEQ